MSDIAERAEGRPATAARAGTAVATGRGRGRRYLREVGWRHVVAVAAVLFALYPIAWIVSSSVNPTGGLAGQKLLPSNPTLSNYQQLLRGHLNTGAEVPFKSWVVNTLQVAAVSAISIVVLSALAAYAFSRMRFRGRRVGLMTMLLVQIFPASLAAVSLFLLLVTIGKLGGPFSGANGKWGLVLVYVGTGLGLNVWLMKGFFDTVPTSLDESARVDGASHAQVFFQIILPLVAPILAVVGLIAFVFIQNDVLLPSAILKQPSQWTLAVGLFRFVSQRYGARWGPFAAGALMGGVPVVVLWFALQRYIVSGLTTGAVKG
jgi:arabinogalactan oligomer / maltooligosaccharide transport system permease protein